MSFTSKTYGYTLTLPAEWLSVQAQRKWNGRSDASYTAPFVDQFVYNFNRSAWAVAEPWNRDLPGYVATVLALNNRYHARTCPATPQAKSRLTVAGEPAILLAFNCGILINLAVTVHHGVGYQFAFRDNDVQAATDPADDAVFRSILRSVDFPR